MTAFLCSATEAYNIGNHITYAHHTLWRVIARSILDEDTRIHTNDTSLKYQITFTKSVLMLSLDGLRYFSWVGGFLGWCVGGWIWLGGSICGFFFL